ncbi:Repeat domain-containing protein [Thiothrix eikelboomii]|uniref:Repeat domain-containing protein n=1 Tax=Thiothrix eikelboomii TaxID=92487 RepID=A0A1T4VRB6_9GAMM|nr:M12 family metallo-peptidase [Thiothrix eikelboomii]SKA67500.1 Repeat domain-containing protein [Thiothrix eikelboomii]
MGFAKSPLLLVPLMLATYLGALPLYAAEQQLNFKEAQLTSALYQAKQVQLAAVPLEANRSAELELESFQVFAPDAHIVVKSSTGTHTLPLPQTNYFKGRIKDQENSAAFMAADAAGNIRSIIQADGQIYVNNNSTQSSQPTARALNPTEDFKQQIFECGIEGNTRFKPPLPAGIKAQLSSAIGAEASTDTYIADLIIETDYEFYSLFNNTSAAAQYVADLIAYVSSLYAAEINTKLRLKQVVLYTSPNDPWTAETTSSALYEVQSYYLEHHAETKRTTVHFLSGKDMNGGVAYIASICTAPAYAGRQSSYDFGVSGGISGSFTPNSPLIVWDAYVVAHELGHNFGSSHTHSYDLDHDYNLPIDCCYSDGQGACQTYQPRTHLPGLGSLTGGSSATHPGTIMSYCHLVSGGSQNVSMTFGLNHPYGVEASRVPKEMRSTVEAYADAYPECLPVDQPTPTTLSFKTVSKWHESFAAQTATPLIGDFNGDQLDDVASFAQQSSHKVFVALSNGSALDSKTVWKTDFALNGEQVAVGDFNGDGKDDLASLTHNSARQMYVSLSNGSSFENPKLWYGLKTAEDGTQVIGDFNGDGKADVATLQPATGAVFVNLSAGQRFRVQRLWTSNAALAAKQIVVGDYNGDGKDDLGFTTTAGEFKVSLAEHRQFAAATVWHSTLASNSTQLVAGDFNADGKEELASYVQNAEGGIYIALSEATHLGTNQRVHAWFEPYDQVLKAGRFTADQASDVMTFTQGSTADVWVATDLE